MHRSHLCRHDQVTHHRRRLLLLRNPTRSDWRSFCGVGMLESLNILEGQGLVDLIEVFGRDLRTGERR